MELHQLLRCVHKDTPIRLFDLHGREICSVLTKEAIKVDLYEYRVYEIKLGESKIYDFYQPVSTAALYITLEK